MTPEQQFACMYHEANNNIAYLVHEAYVIHDAYVDLAGHPVNIKYLEKVWLLGVTKKSLF